jgi:hypothetical protein
MYLNKFNKFYRIEKKRALDGYTPIFSSFHYSFFARQTYFYSPLQ